MQTKTPEVLPNPMGPGKDIWIIPPLSQSEWSQKIDWKLNFQISRSQYFQTPKISDTLETILKSCSLNFENVSETTSSNKTNSDKSPFQNLSAEKNEKPQNASKHLQQLLIASQSHLPNRWVVVNNSAQNLDVYLKKCFETLSNFKQLGGKIFLPQGFLISDAQKIWKKIFQDNSQDNSQIDLENIEFITDGEK